MSQRVAYLVNQYPKVSHTFIRREIHALERAGTHVSRFAIRGWHQDTVDTDDTQERSRTRYLLQDGAGPLLRASIATLLTRPLRLATALRHAVTLGWRADRPLWLHLVYLMEACLLLRWLRAAHAEHLHAHFGTNAAAVALLCRALGGPPFSFTVHGPEEFDRPLTLKLREKAAAAAFVVAISQFGRSQLMRWLRPQDWGKLRVVHCGLDDAAHIGDDVPIPEQPILACVGRLAEQKGQLVLVEAVARLRGEGLALQVALVGDGEMRPEIEHAIARHGLADVIRITGWLSSEQVRQELSHARALVLPSFAEGLPVVVMEAMALQRPVVATWIAGIPELVQDGRCGWLVPAGSIEALADAIRCCLVMRPDDLAAMGRAGRMRVSQRHDIDESARRLSRLFNAGAA